MQFSTFIKSLLVAIIMLLFITPAMMDAFAVSSTKYDADCLVWDSAHIFRGRLLDKADTSAAIPDVSVYIANTSIDLVSDSLGRFELLLPEELFTKKFTISIEGMGYNPVNVVVDPLKINFSKEHVYLLMESKSQYMNGDIQIIDATK